MDKDLAGQDAKELYDVSGQACQSQPHLSKNVLAVFPTNVSLFPAHESYSEIFKILFYIYSHREPKGIIPFLILGG